MPARSDTLGIDVPESASTAWPQEDPSDGQSPFDRSRARHSRSQPRPAGPRSSSGQEVHHPERSTTDAACSRRGSWWERRLYIAGKGDYRPNAPFPEKVENCLNEIRKTLQMAGLDMKHVVKSFVYLEDPDQFPEFNKHYAKFFPDNPPARTTLGVPQVPGDSRVEITCIAYGDLDETKRIGEPPPGLPFSPGVMAGDTLYVSGKGDQLPDGSHPATFEEQVRQSMRNVETTLKQAGLDFKNVVMSHVFLDKYENLEATNKVYSEFFEEGNEPACSTVFVDWIPGGSHVEVTCIATKRPGGPQGRPARRPQARAEPSRGHGEPRRLGGKHPLPVSALPAPSLQGGAETADLGRRSTGWARTTSPSSRRPG